MIDIVMRGGERERQKYLMFIEIMKNYYLCKLFFVISKCTAVLYVGNI